MEKVINGFEETMLSYGAVAVSKAGYEADDLIAALAAATDHVIWSKDGDLMAAGTWYWGGELDPDRYPVTKKKHITAYKALVGDASDKIPGAKGFGEKAFIDMVAKYGDDVLDDLLYMMAHRELDGLSQLVDEFKPFRKIVDNLPAVYASYECARFHHPGWDKLEWKAAFPAPNGDLSSWDQEIRLIGKRELVSPGFLDGLINDLHSGPVQVRGFDIETWQDAESLAWGERNKGRGRPKIDSVACHMAGFSLTCGENNEKVYYFPVNHRDTDNISIEDMTMVLNMLPEDGLLSIHNVSYELPVVRAHCELHFDRGWLPNARCTMIMQNYVDENEGVRLKECTKRIFGYEQQTYEEVTSGRQMNELTGAEVLSYGIDDAIATAALFNLFSLIMQYEGTYEVFESVEVGASYLFAESHLNGLRMDFRRLRELHEESKARYNKLMEKVNDFILNLTWTTGDFDDGVVFHHRWDGCEFVPAKDMSKGEILRCLHSTSTEKRLQTTSRSASKLAVEVAELFGEEFKKPIEESDLATFNTLCEGRFIPQPDFNIRSPDQMCKLMYEALKLPVRLRNKVTPKMKAEGKKKGNPSSDDDAIRLAMAYDMNDRPDLREFFEALLAAKEEAVAESFYYNAYPNMPNPHTGFVHYNAGQSMTTTRRAAPNTPNIGQVSKKSPIREVYVPPQDDMVWVSRDFTGQELRITAERSQCPEMLRCYPQDAPALDLHSVTGVKVLEIVNKVPTTYEEMVVKRKSDKDFKKARNDAKAVNFGDIYGQTEYGLAIKLICTEELAKSIIQAKEEAFPGVARWKKERREFHEKNGYATTMMGARKHVRLRWPGDESTLRSSVNYEIQSSAAEQVKLVLSRLWISKFFERYDAEFQFPVHDEINYCVTLDDLAESIKELGEIMTFPYAGMKVPLTSSIEIGPNFGQLKEIGEEFDYVAIMEAGAEALHQFQERLALGID